VVQVEKEGRLSFHFSDEQLGVLISDMAFHLAEGKTVAFLSGTTSHIIYKPEFSYAQPYLVILHNVRVLYTGTLIVPVINFTQIEKYSFNLTDIRRIESTERKSERKSNSEDVCGVNTSAPAVLLSDSVGVIYRSSFTNINTGAIVVSGGNLTLARIQFTNNIIETAAIGEHSNIRHNLYYTMGASVTAVNIGTDTGKSWFFSSDENNGYNMLINPDVYTVTAVRGLIDTTFTFSIFIYIYLLLIFFLFLQRVIILHHVVYMLKLF
jgi:hypothetical protein